MDTDKIIIDRLNDEQVESLDVHNWQVWEKEISKFHWLYESEEQCLFIEGEADIITKDGTVNIKTGDFITFKKGLECEWNIKQKVKKYYNFK